MNALLRGMILLALFLSFQPTVAMAQTEAAAGASWVDSEGMGNSRGVVSLDVSGRLAVDLWDISAAIARADIVKYDTPRGSKVIYSAGARHWLSRSLFASIAVDYVSAWTPAWSKDVTYIHGELGLCGRFQLQKEKRPHRSEMGLTIIREVRSTMLRPNRVRGLGFFWRHDIPLTSVWFLRGSLYANDYSYAQLEKHREGSSTSVGVSLVWRPHDL